MRRPLGDHEGLPTNVLEWASLGPYPSSETAKIDVALTSFGTTSAAKTRFAPRGDQRGVIARARIRRSPLLSARTTITDGAAQPVPVGTQDETSHAVNATARPSGDQEGWT